MLNVTSIEAVDESPKWKHEKRGTIYTEIATGTLQVSGKRILMDNDRVMIYKDKDDGYYVRFVAEFMDGRFTPLLEIINA